MTDDAIAPSRRGFFLSAGLGSGSLGVSCDGCGSDRTNALSGYLRIGGTINPHVRLGFESNGWYKQTNGVTEQVEIGSAALYIYPSIHNNFWLKGGFGVARLGAANNSDDATADGVAVSAGVGYDWAVSGGSFVLTPFAGYLRQMNGKEKFNGVDDGFTPNASLFQFGLGLGYRH